MVADPADLVGGGRSDPTDARTTVRAISTWRESKPTGARDLKEESTGGTSEGGR